MIESVIMMLIYLCLLAIAVYLIIWVLEQLGLAIPPQVMKILWVIVILFVVLMIVRTVLPAAGIRIGSSLPTQLVIGNSLPTQLVIGNSLPTQLVIGGILPSKLVVGAINHDEVLCLTSVCKIEKRKPLKGPMIEVNHSNGYQKALV